MKQPLIRQDVTNTICHLTVILSHSISFTCMDQFTLKYQYKCDQYQQQTSATVVHISANYVTNVQCNNT